METVQMSKLVYFSPDVMPFQIMIGQDMYSAEIPIPTRIDWVFKEPDPSISPNFMRERVELTDYGIIDLDESVYRIGFSNTRGCFVFSKHRTWKRKDFERWVREI